MHSKTIQNELVEVTGECIRNDIITQVKQAKFYSVIADEMTDAANRVAVTHIVLC